MVGMRWTIVYAFVVLQPDNGRLKRIFALLRRVLLPLRHHKISLPR